MLKRVKWKKTTAQGLYIQTPIGLGTNFHMLFAMAVATNTALL